MSEHVEAGTGPQGLSLPATQAGDHAAGHVWATDITYIPMARGFVYLVAIVDWFSRRVPAWRVSITLEADFCIEALEESLTRFGKPAIFNTDQGSRFTSAPFISVLKREEIAISMNGRGCRRDNVFVERLWRPVKYEEVYLPRLRFGSRESLLFLADRRLIELSIGRGPFTPIPKSEWRQRLRDAFGTGVAEQSAMTNTAVDLTEKGEQVLRLFDIGHLKHVALSKRSTRIRPRRLVEGVVPMHHPNGHSERWEIFVLPP